MHTLCYVPTAAVYVCEPPSLQPHELGVKPINVQLSRSTTVYQTLQAHFWVSVVSVVHVSAFHTTSTQAVLGDIWAVKAISLSKASHSSMKECQVPSGQIRCMRDATAKAKGSPKLRDLHSNGRSCTSEAEPLSAPGHFGTHAMLKWMTLHAATAFL